MCVALTKLGLFKAVFLLRSRPRRHRAERADRCHPVPLRILIMMIYRFLRHVQVEKIQEGEGYRDL